MRGFVVVCLFVLLFDKGSSEFFKDHRKLSVADCIAHLVRFGYLEKKDLPDVWLPDIGETGPTDEKLDSDRRLPVKLEKAVFEFQRYAGLNETGKLDDRTKMKMVSPRCGNPDTKFEFMPGRPKWPRRGLTYKITQYSGRIRNQVVDTDIRRAFEYWERVTPLRFIKSNDRTVDIEIFFARRRHRDEFPFDGQSGVLAHAFGPDTSPQSQGGLAGDVHFDDDEPWVTDNERGQSLLQTAVHEIGHSLGLSHSNVRNAVMYAFASNGIHNKDFKLHSDDIQGIQYLYGGAEATERPTPPHVPPPPPPPTNRPQAPEAKPGLCADPTLDVITTLSDGNIYAFKGAYYFIIDKNGEGIYHNRTARIDSTFRGLPSNLDAAVVSPNSGRTYFFKGKYYWRFNGKQPDGNGEPILISKGFPGIPDNVDTAFVWSGNKKLYFFKGGSYWMYDPAQSPPVASKFPLDIAHWRGIPYNINAAFIAPHGPTFFFKGGQYWRFDDNTFSVPKADPPYPRSTRLMWFGCHKYRPDLKDVDFLF